MSNRTGRVIYAGFRPGLDLDSHWFTHFVAVSGFFMFSFLFSFSKKLKFSVCIRFSLFNLIMWNDSLVIQWLSNVHLLCWFADSERQIFFYWRGKKSCSLCHWNFWIVASGSADNFNEEINMFIFYTVYLWMERRAVTLWRVVLCPLLVFAASWGGVPVQPPSLAGLWAVLSPHVWHLPMGDVGSAVPAAHPAVPAPLCPAGAGTMCRTKSMGSWGSNPTHWYEQTLLPLQQWGWDGGAPC